MPPLRPRGRPVRDSEPELRRAVRDLFDLFGPGLGTPLLLELFPSMARREIDDLAYAYRREHLGATRTVVQTLTWTTPGTVWAMDYKTPPAPIEGLYRAVLVVRDLASGYTLLTLPVEADDAHTTEAALRSLFVQHGPPLVLKSDNGGHFVNDLVARLLDEQRVLPLLSPFFTPSFNGSCEAGIGALSIRAHFHAARSGHPGEWTLDVVEAARAQGNELGRPFGRCRPTPAVAWASRRPIAASAREDLAAAVRRNRLALLSERGYQEGTPLGANIEHSVERDAVSGALSHLGFVQFRRRSVPLPLNPGLRPAIA